MNRHGETFEENPPAGTYWLCPLPTCTYKLLHMLPLHVAEQGQGMSPTWALGGKAAWMGPPPTGTLGDFVAMALHEHMRNREERLMLHLQSHDLMDFYQARVQIMNDAHAKADQLMSIADKVFRSTATRETTEGGH